MAKSGGILLFKHLILVRSSGAGDPRCALYIVAGKTRFDGEAYKQQSVVLVPAKTAGVKVVRYLNVYGYDESPHGI
jgi:acyl-CoA dehydrogenase